MLLSLLPTTKDVVNLEEKDRLREAFLLAVYDVLGSNVGRDGTLAEIALEQAKTLGLAGKEGEIFNETVFHWKKRGLGGNLTMRLGGGLTPQGVDYAERLQRERSASGSSKVSDQLKQRPRKGEKAVRNWVFFASECIGKGGNGVVYGTAPECCVFPLLSEGARCSSFLMESAEADPR